jgi:hypothetical protein
MDNAPSHIGIDFDNTIADYDHLFVEEGVRAGWYPSGHSGSKQSVRDHVRASCEDGERSWQILQARVYAHRMPDARVMIGFGDFLRRCADRDILVSIVSHKTRFATRDESRTDLRGAALLWLVEQGYLDSGTFGLARDRIYFEATRAEKIARIGEIACSDFIDDLIEVLAEPAFPGGVRKHLLTRQDESIRQQDIAIHPTWGHIADALL